MQPHPHWPESLTFIGGGNMARSLIGGLLAGGFDPASIHVADPNEAVRDALKADFGVHVHANATAAAAKGATWLLAVKPQVMQAVCASLRDLALTQKPLLISILAGTTTERLRDALQADIAIVRAMPNTPALISKGATGLFANATASAGQRDEAAALLQAVGIVAWVEDEALIDSVTALSGSGPAYVFLLAEALIDAAVAQGLPQEAASRLAIQTLVGASDMLQSSGKDAITLRQQVTSPNGTTQAAVESFEASGLRDTVRKALDAARDRGQELAKL